MIGGAESKGWKTSGAAHGGVLVIGGAYRAAYPITPILEHSGLSWGIVSMRDVLLDAQHVAPSQSIDISRLWLACGGDTGHSAQELAKVAALGEAWFAGDDAPAALVTYGDAQRWPAAHALALAAQARGARIVTLWPTSAPGRVGVEPGAALSPGGERAARADQIMAQSQSDGRLKGLLATWLGSRHQHEPLVSIVMRDGHNRVHAEALTKRAAAELGWRVDAPLEWSEAGQGRLSRSRVLVTDDATLAIAFAAWSGYRAVIVGHGHGVPNALAPEIDVSARGLGAIGTLVETLEAPELDKGLRRCATALAGYELLERLTPTDERTPQGSALVTALTRGGQRIRRVHELEPLRRTNDAEDAASREPMPEVISAMLRDEFRGVFAGFALQTLLDHYEFDTVLDVGSGEGTHAELFLSHGKQVTAIDYGKSVYFERNRGRVKAIVADFNTHVFESPFDCVWASHVLEHQVNVGVFLSRVIRACAEGGVLALTVPPLKHEIVGGHVTLWNAGLMLYVLAVAGLDVREAAVCRYGYNISVIVRKRTAQDVVSLAYDKGDVDRLKARLPSFAREGFDGDIALWRWPGLESLSARTLEGVAR